MPKHNTPLRYPGGKQKITPFIREILESNGLCGSEYIEPYAGGAGVGIDLLLCGDVSHIHLNDSCFKVFSIWWAILNHTEDFCRRIRNSPLTIEEWRRHQQILKLSRVSRLDLGFSAFYLNRVNRSGILTGGLIGGLAQTGEWKMDARFPREELIRRVEAIASRRKHISVLNLDAEDLITTYLPKIDKKALVYFDPPYFKKADRLYLNHYRPEDHSRLAKAIQRQVKLPWLVSYDNVAEIQSLYSKRKSFTYDLQYNAAKYYKGAEFFAFSDRLKIPKHSSLNFVQAGLSKFSI